MHDHPLPPIPVPPSRKFVCSTAVHPSTDVPLVAFLAFSALVLYLETASYGKWLFNQTSGLNRANPSYQLAVVGNFLVATLGTKARRVMAWKMAWDGAVCE